MFLAGTASEISAMNLVYYGKILSPNATVCYNNYSSQYNGLYSSAAGNFSQSVESQINSTVTTLETLKTEIETLISGLVNSLDQIIDDQSFASIGAFVRIITTRIGHQYKFSFQIESNTPTLGNTVVNWVTEFSAVMKQIQQGIKDGFNKYDSQRVNDTLSAVEQTLNCLQSA